MESEDRSKLQFNKNQSQRKLNEVSDYLLPKTVTLNQIGDVAMFKRVKHSIDDINTRRHKSTCHRPVDCTSKTSHNVLHTSVCNKIPKVSNSGSLPFLESCDTQYEEGSSSNLKTETKNWHRSKRAFELAPTGESYELPSWPCQQCKKITNLVHTGKHDDDSLENVRNAQPPPFQPQNFMSSAKMKKVYLSRRHQDTFGGSDYTLATQRGVPLHTSRYLSDGPLLSHESMEQRDRIQLQYDCLDKVKYMKLRRDIWPHRADIDFTMAGKKMDFDERFDLNKELMKLKSMVLPTVARDLLHGKGVTLPPTHGSLKPRKPLRELSAEYNNGSSNTQNLMQKPDKKECNEGKGVIHNSSIISLPAIDNHDINVKHRASLARTRHHAKSLRSLLSL